MAPCGLLCAVVPLENNIIHLRYYSLFISHARFFPNKEVNKLASHT